MCRENFCEENNQINNVDLVNNEIDLSESEENSTVTITHKINCATLIPYIKGVANDQAQDSFINPNPVQDKPLPAFKDRTKNIDEVIHHLEVDCDLAAITID